MLYIHPDECVDCGACEPVCPVEAICYEDDLPESSAPYLEDNARFFTEILPGRDGLCHISELSSGYISSIDKVVGVGDAMKVLVIDVDEHDRVKLSRRQALEELGEEDEIAALVAEQGDERGGDRDRGDGDDGDRPRRRGGSGRRRGGSGGGGRGRRD